MFFSPSRRGSENPRTKKSKPDERGRHRQARLQVLEDRRVLSITPPVLLADSTLVILGGELDDTVVVSESADNAMIVVQQYELGKRVTTSFPRSSVASLQFFGREGDDRLTNQTDVSVYAEGGEGVDILTGGPASDYLYGGEGNDRLVGGGGDDVLFGDDGVDVLLGDSGNDRLDGGHGDDLLYSGNGDDRALGGDGNDRLEGAAGDDYLNGGRGNDRLYGGADNDELLGAAGNDRLVGQAGDDSLQGGDGEDVLQGESGDDLLSGGLDDDLIYGGDGNDRLLGDGGADRLKGEAGEDYLNGGEGNDTLTGGSENDFLNGAAGNDRLAGHTGNDILLGGDGSDSLFGDSGADRLDGGRDDDTLYGGDGPDRLLGSSGADRLEGEAGDDYLNGGEGNDLLTGGSENDFLNGSSGDDRLVGQVGNDVLLGGDGDDTLFGDSGADRLDGGRDDDTLYGGEDNDLLYGRSGADRLEGEAGADHLNGGPGNDLILGSAGDDYLKGEAGEDRIEAGDGNDTLLGGDGVDALFGGNGADHISGGNEDDTLYGDGGEDFVSGDAGNDRIEGGADRDTLRGGSGSDYIFGGTGADHISGGEGDDRLEGQDGNDIVLGEDGDDVLHGGQGDDRLEGSDGTDLIYGGDGNDSASGGDGDDRVFGEAGDDELIGGAGDDNLLGGDGHDHLAGNSGADRLEGEVGADVLLGGDGDDTLIAGEGRDLVIGGLGADSVSGSAGDDILIGASTAYDQDSAALREALSTWNSNEEYAQRVEALTAHQAAVRFAPHATVFADFASDRVDGGGDRDWFIQSATNGVYNPLSAEKPLHGDGGHHQHMLLDAPPTLEGFSLIDSIDRLENVDQSETVHSLLAHSNHRSKRGEHLMLFQLVRYADVTHTAIASGDWSSPSTWASGNVPTTGARVLVPYGAIVTVDHVISAELSTVRVDGTLTFATNADTELRVDTVVVTGTGTFVMGNADAPVQRGFSATLHITDDGPIDRAADPFALGRGLITHGSVSLHGDAVSSFTTAVGGLRANDTVIHLSSVPAGWAIGDKIAIAGTAIGGGEDEVRTIRAINGAVVAIDPLSFDHTPLDPGLEVHIANTTRNVVIESTATMNDRRGHVMFMHNREVEISYATFNGLGRTAKSIDLTDPEVDESWHLIGDTGANPRGRYAVHFHRNGVQADSPPATVHGSVVNGGPSWGFVNHSSYADFTENVSYGATGAAFVAEAGDEIGLFDNNLALHTTGTTEDVDARVGIQDFGFNGDGFWLQSPGVTVTNNIASGSTGSAFIYYTRGLRVGGNQVEFLSENLEDPSVAVGQTTIRVIHTPIKRFEGNVGYASGSGLTVRYNLRDASHDAQSVVSDSVFWNNRTGVDVPYAHNTVLRDLVVLAEPSPAAINGVDNNSQTRSITYQNLRIEGYQRALIAPVLGDNRIEGGRYISSLANILVNSAASNGTRLLVTGAPQFGGLGGSLVKEVTMNFKTDNAARNPSQVFYLLEVRLDYGPYSNQQLYFRQQDASAVPFPEPVPGLPPGYVGLTQSQLFQQFGVAVGGAVAPSNAFVSSDVLGLIGPTDRA